MSLRSLWILSGGGPAIRFGLESWLRGLRVLSHNENNK